MNLSARTIYFFALSLGAAAFTQADVLKSLSTNDLVTAIIKTRRELQDASSTLLRQAHLKKPLTTQINKDALEYKITLYEKLVKEAAVRLEEDIEVHPEIISKLSFKARQGIQNAIDMVRKEPLSPKLAASGGALAGLIAGTHQGFQVARQNEQAALAALFTVPIGAISGLIAGALYGYGAASERALEHPDLTQKGDEEAVSFLNKVGERLDDVEAVLEERSLQHVRAKTER